ncbi:protein FAM200C-like [Lepeophtheirus salmonis]|uniref:protein FAM200C-like n=1 Tax=Lepeophtheirus salmonis TaxID=72036 RepID=UPI003AF37A73
MILVHFDTHRANLVAKNITPPLNEVLRSVIKCNNAIKANAKCEPLFKQFCENESADYVRLLLPTDVRWLSKGNCLKRFMVLYDILRVFLNNKPVDGKAFVSYLTDIFEKLNMLNKQLQGSSETHVDAKTKIFGFVTFIKVFQENISHKIFEQFHWLKECEMTVNAVLVIVDHLKIIVSDFKERFSDLIQI